ncbi:SDR family NAD(P)-dependent oxidoreductase [Pseudoponticoccus marisrubri]|uniref:Short-chain dehydrogenase n=1 Tax=Pseudoponticoccus marisrubri TaxID=1685382 RepID=A0A0W7WI05_9RHOB|nr:SDR family NAD(P)-dependent oxidoreductase [Pseudoponticoccus marisrubri]KUF10236.1 short-chain dehydrogenase [Pseudoponticoccus marisrubri]
MATVLITGAGRGIGAALDRALSARGDTVLGTARDHPEYLQLEVTDPASHRALATQLEGRAIDTLVCNAGIYPDKGQNLADGFPAEMWAQTFAVNVTGVFLTVQALLPNLQLSDTPRIAIIGSQMGSDTRAPGGSYIYRASKAAVLNLGRNLAMDLKNLDIAVGVYHPGWVRTDMGGETAEISVDEAAEGLAARFDALSLQTTGCFETWDGRAHPF